MNLWMQNKVCKCFLRCANVFWEMEMYTQGTNPFGSSLHPVMSAVLLCRDESTRKILYVKSYSQDGMERPKQPGAPDWQWVVSDTAPGLLPKLLYATKIIIHLMKNCNDSFTLKMEDFLNQWWRRTYALTFHNLSIIVADFIKLFRLSTGRFPVN